MFLFLASGINWQWLWYPAHWKLFCKCFTFSPSCCIFTIFGPPLSDLFWFILARFLSSWIIAWTCNFATCWTQRRRDTGVSEPLLSNNLTPYFLRLLATRRPPVMPVHPQHDDSAQIRHLPSVLPPLSQGRPNIRRSPAPSRSNRADHYDHGDLPGTSGDVGRFPCASNQTSGKPISPDSPTSKDNRGSNASKVRYVSKMAQYAYMPNGDFIARFSDGMAFMILDFL